MYANYLWIIYIVCLTACFMGFKKYVWFHSVGHGFAIILGSAAAGFIFAGSLRVIPALQLSLLMLYGARYSGSLIYAEREGLLDPPVNGNRRADGTLMPGWTQILIWLGVSLLYTIEISPVVFRMANGAVDTVLPVIGLVISFCGLAFEVACDIYRATRSASRNTVKKSGKAKVITSPYWYGTVVFWTGMFIGSVSCLNSLIQWIFAFIAWLSGLVIVYKEARLEYRNYKR